MNGMVARIVVLPVCALGPPVRATVTVSGGADTSGHFYTWTITHDEGSPVVSVEVPQYMADLCMVPDGWIEQLTHPLGAGGQAGTCVATAGAGAVGAAPGGSIKLTLRVGPKGAPRGRGTIVVTFADGTQRRIAAEVPVEDSFLDRNVSLIGLGVMFCVYLIARSVRRRPRRLA